MEPHILYQLHETLQTHTSLPPGRRRRRRAGWAAARGYAGGRQPLPSCCGNCGDGVVLLGLLLGIVGDKERDQDDCRESVFWERRNGVQGYTPDCMGDYITMTFKLISTQYQYLRAMGSETFVCNLGASSHELRCSVSISGTFKPKLQS